MLSFVRGSVKKYLGKERSIFTILIIFFTVLSIILYWIAIKETRTTLDDEFLHREQVSARSGSQSISGFINLLGKNVALSAQDLSEDTSLAEMQKYLNGFLNHWEDTPVVGILLADQDGKVIEDVNRTMTSKTGGSVIGEPFFPWAKNATSGDYFVDRPVMETTGYSAGKYIVPIASPLIVNGKFSGVISVAVNLQDLIFSDVNSLETTENTRILLLDENGIVLSSTSSKLIGSSYFDFLSGYSYQGRDKTINVLKSALISDVNEGKLDIELPDSLNPEKVDEFLIAYSRIRVGDHNWLLAVKSPKSDSDIYLWRIKNAIYGVFVFTLLLVVLFSVTHLRYDRIRRKRKSK